MRKQFKSRDYPSFSMMIDAVHSWIENSREIRHYDKLILTITKETDTLSGAVKTETEMGNQADGVAYSC